MCISNLLIFWKRLNYESNDDIYITLVTSSNYDDLLKELANQDQNQDNRNVDPCGVYLLKSINSLGQINIGDMIQNSIELIDFPKEDINFPDRILITQTNQDIGVLYVGIAYDVFHKFPANIDTSLLFSLHIPTNQSYLTSYFAFEEITNMFIDGKNIVCQNNLNLESNNIRNNPLQLLQYFLYNIDCPCVDHHCFSICVKSFDNIESIKTYGYTRDAIYEACTKDSEICNSPMDNLSNIFYIYTSIINERNTQYENPLLHKIQNI